MRFDEVPIRLVLTGALALTGCTYDYQGAIDGPSSTSGGGAPSTSTASNPGAGAMSSQGGNGAGAAGSASTASASSQASTSTGGPTACNPAQGQLVMVNDDGHFGDEPWSACAGADLTTNLANVDSNNDCVDLLTTNATNISHWLTSKFTFALPGDAVVGEIEIDVRRRASVASRVEDRTVKIGPSGNLMTVSSTDVSGDWSADWETHFYKLTGAFSPSDVSYVQFIFQTNNTSNQDVSAKVDQVTAKVAYSSSSCP